MKKLKIVSLLLVAVLLAGVGYYFFSFESLRAACVEKTLQDGRTVVVQFDPSVSESSVTKLAHAIESRSGVEKTEILSSAEVFKEFEAKHKDDPFTLQTIESLQKERGNQFGPMLVVTFTSSTSITDSTASEIDGLAKGEGLTTANVVAHVATESEVESIKHVSFLGDLNPLSLLKFGRARESLKECAEAPTLVQELI